MNKKIRTLTLALALTFASLAGTPFAHGQAVPSFINYQGRLTTATGNPIADGNVTLTLRLFGGPTGGSPIWDSGTITVPVRGGVFSVLLGSGGMPILTPSVFTLNGLLRSAWLEIEPQGSPPLTPRQQIATVPFAYMAETVSDGAITGPKLADGSVSQPKISVNSIDSTRLASDAASLAKLTSNYLASPALPYSLSTDTFGSIATNGLYFMGGGSAPDGRASVRLVEGYGMRFSAVSSAQVLSTANSFLVGYAPSGQDWGVGNAFISGNVGIGTSSPTQRLDVNGNARLQDLFMGGWMHGINGTLLYQDGTVVWINPFQHWSEAGIAAGNKLIFQTGSVRRMVVTPQGRVGIGTEDPASLLHVAGRIRGNQVSINGDNNGTYALTLPNIADSTGRGIANRWDNYSSRRLKEKIRSISNPIGLLNRLEGVRFRWKSTQGGGEDIGLIAEDVATVIPEVVSVDQQGKAIGVAYDRLVALLIEAGKEQQAQIEGLQRKNRELDARLKALEARIGR